MLGKNSFKAQTVLSITQHVLKVACESGNHTFGFGDQLTAVHHLHLANGSVVGVRLLSLDGPDDVLAGNHLTEHHVDADWIRQKTQIDQ